ncbi:hypothetical protein J5N97_026627 [Dioscorea zingiberensis]|uniref:PGG domain-containing protein n=1 Tax=Dioscorea zingiberensis TaxID=325984 RepID=A0A9D5C3N6_9LILI|nr:hypothetical protein J5N97_026627 [Dioscorea zingiberensis]
MGASLLLAARSGDLETLESLLSPDYNQIINIDVVQTPPHQPNLSPPHETETIFGVTAGGNTLLHIAAQYGQPRIAEEVCRRECSLIATVNARLESSLHLCAKSGHLNVTEVIINYIVRKGGFEDVLRVKNMKGDTAFCSQRVVRYVLERPNLEKLLNDQDYEGNTPLHLAVTMGGKEIVYDFIKDDRLDSRVMNNEGLTPLDLSQKLNDHLKFPFNASSLIIRCLVDFGAIISPKRSDLQKRNRTHDLESEKLCITVSQSLAIVSMLIATVTFAAGFTVPGGYWSSNG